MLTPVLPQRVGWGIRVLAAGAVLAAASLVHPLAASAQTTPWVQLDIVQVRPDLVDEYLAVQLELSIRAREAGIAYRHVIRTAAFGDPYRFIVATPVEKLAVFDTAPAPDPKLAALFGREQRCISSRQTYAMRSLPDLDLPLPAGEQPGLMLVSMARVARGREQDYLSTMLNDVLPHFEKAGVPYVTGDLTFGGEGGYVHFFYVKDFAQLDEGSPVLEALGPAGAQAVMAKLSGVVTSHEQWLARRIPEVSHPVVRR